MACGGFFTLSATGCKAGRDIGRGIKRKPIGLSIPVECDGPRPMGYFITEKFLYISLYWLVTSTKVIDSLSFFNLAPAGARRLLTEVIVVDSCP